MGSRRGRGPIALIASVLFAGALILAACGAAPGGGKAAAGKAAASGVPAGMPTSTSLKGWHVGKSGTVALSTSTGDPKPPSLKLPGDGHSYVWADLGKPVDQFSFDVNTQGLFDFFFGANKSGQGYIFRIDTRGGTNYSGFATSSSWTKWDCPQAGSTTDPAGAWLHVVISIKGTNVTATVTGTGVKETVPFTGQVVGCTSSGTNKTLGAYKAMGNAFGFQGDGLGPTSYTWIANFR